MAFQSSGFKSADAAPDDRFYSAIVPVEPSEHFTTFSADDDLGETVIAAVASFFAIGTGFDYSPANQFFLYLSVNVFRNNSFVVTFYIVLRDETVIFDSGFVQKVSCIGFLEQGIADVFLIA